MGLELDSLEIRVQSQSDAAASGLDKLSASLSQLRSAAKGGAGLNSTVNQLTKLSKALSSLGDMAAVSNIASALKPLQALEKASGFISTVNALKKLPEVTKALSSQELQKFALQIRLVTKYMAPLATEMEKVSKGFAAFPVRIQRIIQGNSGLAASNKRLSGSFTDLVAKSAAYLLSLRHVLSFLADCVSSINDYVENVNLFQVSMGEFYDEAFAYAQLVNEKLGIDPAQWMRTQGVFMSIANGFGIANEQAYALSEGLAELSYDLSSLYNEDMESSALRLQSALAGEIEPIRRLGIAISEASLKEFALEKGITKSVESMTEQEKALLRTIKLMEGAANLGAIGDFARTLESPANALRVLNQQITQFKRAIGSVMIPVLMQVLPYLQAFVELLTEAISDLATLVGFTMPTWDTNAWSSGVASGASDATNAVEGTTAAMKELKNATLGIDELNILAPPDGGSGSSGAGGAGWASGLEIEDIWDKDALAAMSSKVDDLKDSLRPIFDLAVDIGAAFLAWKIASSFLSALSRVKDFLSGLKGSEALKNLGWTLGLGANFADDVRQFLDALQDIVDNGANFSNITDLISGFAGALGNAFVLLGNTSLGGALLVISGLSGLVHNIADIAENGVDFDNALGVVDSIGQLLLAIGVLAGNKKLAAAGLVIRGVTTVVEEIPNVLEALKTGDWSGVDKAALAIGALQVVGGLVIRLSAFKKAVDASGGGKTIAAAGDTVGDLASAVGDSKSGGLTTKLSTLAKNLGLGLVVIGEVATAAALVVGAIAILGLELKAVGDAWDPVFENGMTTVAAFAAGVGVLGAVGLATDALGKTGPTVVTNLGVGIGILAEVGLAAGLLLVEIQGVGNGLADIKEAWAPVFSDKDAVVSAVVVGTAALVAFAAACWAIGNATIASGLTIPLAIGAGTLVLVGVAKAAQWFVSSVSDVAWELSDNLAPALESLNPKLPTLSEDLSLFVAGLEDVSGVIADYTSSLGSLTWSSIVAGFISLFSDDPLGTFSDAVAEVGDGASRLTERLKLVIPELQTLETLLSDYAALLAAVDALSQAEDANDLGADLSVNMQEAGAGLISGLASGMRSALPEYIHELDTMKSEFALRVSEMTSSASGLLDEITRGFSEANLKLSQLLTDAARTVGNKTDDMAFDFESFSRRAVSAISDIIQKLKTIPARIDTTYTITMQMSGGGGDIPGFASGGFPEYGQLFLANEPGAGPELVGTIGRQTAVANTEQIVQGIAAGVSEANLQQNALLREQNELLRAILEKEGTTYLDGKKLYKSAEKAARNTGVVIMTGGVV